MPLTTAMTKVKDQVHRGVPLEHIEAFIEGLPVTDEDRAVLWLLAWADGDLQAVSFDLGRVHD